MANTITVADIQITMSVKGAAKAKTDMDKTNASINNLGNVTKKSTGKIAEMWKSLKRIATYRLLRTAIKSITQGFSEGIKNLYQWSKIGDGRFAASMDRMTTALLQMKNSLAVSIAPLIENVIVPLMEKLASIFIATSNQISMFAARLKGETKYLGVATTATKAYANAQRSLLGFDELNKLSGNATNIGNMFSYFDVDTNSIGSKFATIFTSLELKIKEIIPEFEMSGTVVAAAIGVALAGLVAGVKAFSGIATSTNGVMVIGIIAALGLTIANIVAEVKALEGDDLLTVLEHALIVLAGGAIGFALKGATGGIAGISIGVGISLLLKKLDFDNVEGPDVLIKACKIFLASLMGGLIGISFGGNVGGLVGLTIAFSLSMLLSDTSLINAAGITPKGLTDMLLGAILGVGAGLFASIMGASVLSAGLIGLTVGVVLTLTLSKIQTDWDNGKIKYTEAGDMYYDPDGTPTSTYKTTNGSVGGGRKFANGGFPSEGSMFIAGESGPELVGTIGGRTGVMNTDQMAMSLAAANDGVVQAIYQIANTITNAINNQPVPSIRIGDREIYKASQRGARTIGGNLVQGV